MEHRPDRNGVALASQDEPRRAMQGGSRQVRNLLIVEDHPLMLQALSMTLNSAFGLSEVRTAPSLGAAEADIRSNGVPDAVVLDLNLPDVKVVEGVISLKPRTLGAPITVISAEVDPEMVAMVIGAGACGFLSKSMPPPEMIEAFRRMWAGETVVPPDCDLEADAEEARNLVANFATLTPQQMRILSLICQGRPNKIISYELSISEATVKTHIAAIMSKIKVQNRTQAALMASKARLFSR